MEHSFVVREATPLYGKNRPPFGFVREHLAEEGAGAVTANVAGVKHGLPFAEFEALRSELDLPAEKLAAYLHLARATLHRRKIKGPFTADESDKLLRFARLLGQAKRLFGSVEDAREWLRAPQHGLGGAVPLEYAGTEVGAREVESLLGRIDYGVYS